MKHIGRPVAAMRSQSPCQSTVSTGSVNVLEISDVQLSPVTKKQKRDETLPPGVSSFRDQRQKKELKIIVTEQPNDSLPFAVITFPDGCTFDAGVIVGQQTMFYLKPVRNPREKLDRWKWVVTEKEFDLATQEKFPVLVRPDLLCFDGRIPSSVLFRILVTLARRKGEAVREEVQALINQCTERWQNKKIPLSARTVTYDQFIKETIDKTE
jgi:hypothetical protein